MQRKLLPSLWFYPGLAACALLLLVGGVLLADDAVAWSDGLLKISANAIPVALLYLAALGLTRRPLVALLLSLAFLGAVFAANRAKINHLGEPVTFPDFFLIEQAISAWHLASKYISVWFYVALVLVLVLLVAGLRYEKPFGRLASLSLLVVSVLGFSFLLHAGRGVEPLYSTSAHGAQPWVMHEMASKQGLVASLVTSARVARLKLPDYDRHRLNDLVARYHLKRQEPELQVRPDVVLWLAESFFDPAIIQDVDRCQFLPTYCELVEQSVVTSLKVPTFGGNTTRTEFEVLTGIPYRSLGTQDFPYAAVVHDEFNSLAWTLAERGYTATAIHPHQAQFWQRNRALPLLGFAHFIAGPDMPALARDGLWPSDEALADFVIQRLSEKAAPQFVFAISMEGHGPFDRRDVQDNAERDAIAPLPGIDGELLDNWRQYIYHARRSARALQKIKAFVDSRDRPTLVVYFGDHLPGLRRLFQQLEFRDGKSPYEQKTPALAFANYELPVSWRPEASYELGLWTLMLSGQAHSDHFSQLAVATGMAKLQQVAAVSEALDAFRVRQLYR